MDKAATLPGVARDRRARNVLGGRLEATLAAIRQEASAGQGGLRGRLAINAFRSAAAHILPGVIAQLTEHPMILGDFTCWAIVHEELRERDALGSR